MGFITRLLACLSVLALTLLAVADDATPQLLIPTEGKIYRLAISDPTFGTTNCYLLVGKTGEAIIIDPADTLERVNDVTLLVDITTRKSTRIATDGLQAYTSVGRDTVVDPNTGTKYFTYDQFRPTEKYGPAIVKLLEDHHWTLKLIVLTHGHMDHFGSLGYLQKHTGAMVLMHEDDLRAIDGGLLPKDRPKTMAGYPKDAYRIEGLAVKVDRPLREGDLVTLDGMSLQVLHTPGHSPGGLCLRTTYQGTPILISGDTLLGLLPTAWGEQTVGISRTNFIDGSGDEAVLFRTIREKLLTLPTETLIYPGHGDPTTIGEEQRALALYLAPPDAEENTPEK